MGLTIETTQILAILGGKGWEGVEVTDVLVEAQQRRFMYCVEEGEEIDLCYTIGREKFTIHCDMGGDVFA